MFRLVSDVHLEFMKPPQVTAWIRSMVPLSPGEVLVLAGDICSILTSRGKLNSVLVDVLETLKRRWDHVVYVPGNHEYYGTLRHHMPFSEAEGLLVETCRRLGIHFLQKGVFAVPGTDLTVLGCTLWTLASSQAASSMNDVNYVSENPSDVFVDHLAWLRSEISKHRKVVVVTHHLPSLACVHPIYASYPDQTGYATDLHTLAPELFTTSVIGWMHGHSHESMDVSVGKVRIVSNPTGYPGEKKVTRPTSASFFFH